MVQRPVDASHFRPPSGRGLRSPEVAGPQDTIPENLGLPEENVRHLCDISSTGNEVLIWKGINFLDFLVHAVNIWV